MTIRTIIVLFLISLYLVTPNYAQQGARRGPKEARSSKSHDFMPDTERAVGRAVLARTPHCLRSAYSILESASYPIESRDALIDRVLDNVKAPQTREEAIAAGIIIDGFLEHDFPLKDHAVAIGKVQSRIPLGYPPPRPPNPLPPVPMPPDELPAPIPEEDPYFDDADFGDDECAQAAESRLLSGWGDGQLRAIGTLRMLVRSCRDAMPPYPDSYCGDQARRAFAQRYIEIQTPSVSLHELYEDLMNLPEAIEDRLNRAANAESWAAGWSQVVYSVCMESLTDLPSPFDPNFDID